MAYVVAATWRAKPGKEAAIEEVIRIMTERSLQEPATLMFIAHRSVDDPAEFYLYEQYTDAAGFEAHKETPHFKKYVLEQAVPNLDFRERAIYETLD